MTRLSEPRGIGRALSDVLGQSALFGAPLSKDTIRALIDVKTTLANLLRGDLSYLDDTTLLRRLEQIEARLPTRETLLPRRRSPRLLLLLDFDAVFGSDLREEAPHPAQAHIADRLFDHAAVERMKAIDTEFSPLYVPTTAWRPDPGKPDLLAFLKIGWLEFVAENVHPDHANLNCTSSDRGALWGEVSLWLRAQDDAPDSWVIFEHVELGVDISVPDECRNFVVQRPAGAPFTDDDYEALRAALLRRERELRTLR